MCNGPLRLIELKAKVLGVTFHLIECGADSIVYCAEFMLDLVQFDNRQIRIEIFCGSSRFPNNCIVDQHTGENIINTVGLSQLINCRGGPVEADIASMRNAGDAFKRSREPRKFLVKK